MSDMKCPFCQQRLLQEYNRQRDAVIYHCTHCYFQGDGILWQELIRTRKALDKAKQDLEIARNAADNSREKLAAFMHDTWGNWFAYQLNNSTVENLQRWGMQSNAPYSSLTETDKDKDRKFADKIIEIIKDEIKQLIEEN